MRIFCCRQLSTKVIPRMARHKRLLLFISFLLFVLALHYILKWENRTDEVSFANIDIDIPEDFQPVMITERETFPSEGSNRIPKIIHQTWKNKNIPVRFARWIKSWLHHHPGWEYWLWTDESAGLLIAEKYPHLLDIYFGYMEPIRRADALRYVVLHEFGGVYADMDMEALSPLDPLTRKYSCFIGQEPYEHPILDSNFEQLIINAIMGCRKGHPFMKMLMDNLPDFFHMWNYLDSTGPHFVTAVYHKYLKEQDKYDSADSMYVAPAEYFYPKIDPDKIYHMTMKCSKVGSLTRLQLKACRNLKFKHSKGLVDATKSIAFTNHHWYHTYLTSEFSFSYRYVDVSNLIPKVKIYEMREMHQS